MATITVIGNDECGISRLYTFLANVKNFPTPVQFAAITAGISEQEVRHALDRTPLAVVGDQIMPRDELERLGQMSAGEAHFQYHMFGLIVHCQDGRPVHQSTES